VRDGIEGDEWMANALWAIEKFKPEQRKYLIQLLQLTNNRLH